MRFGVVARGLGLLALGIVVAVEPVTASGVERSAVAAGHMTAMGAVAHTAVPSARKIVLSKRMQKAYKKAGGKRVMGVPTAKTRCGLPERGCLQQLSKGVIYLQRNGKVTSVRARGTKGDILAVAKSQVGFKQKWRGWTRIVTKYGKYNGATSPVGWCGQFQTWVAYAAGHRKLLPKNAVFANYKTYLKENFKRVKKPRTGAYVLFSGGIGYESHTGIVLQPHRDGSATIIEGNAGATHVIRIRRYKADPDLHFYFPYA